MAAPRARAATRRTEPPPPTAPIRENRATLANCFVTRHLPGDALDRLAEAHDLEIWPEPVPPPHAALTERAPQLEGLIALPTDRVDAELIGRAPRLRAISNYAVGYDNVDIPAARERGIPVGHTPGVLTDATADLAFALLLSTARHLPQAERDARHGKWLTWDPTAYLGVELAGARLGIIGFGRIGQAVARRAEGFGMSVLHATSQSSPDDLQALLQTSDFVSLHCPLTDTTRHLINATALNQMKPTAILINTARGGIVDHDALAHALNNHQIAGAGIDVAEPEPIPPGHPLLDAPNLTLTPHIGSATHTAREKMADLAVDNLLAGLAGEPMPHEVPA